MEDMNVQLDNIVTKNEQKNIRKGILENQSKLNQIERKLKDIQEVQHREVTQRIRKEELEHKNRMERTKEIERASEIVVAAGIGLAIGIFSALGVNKKK